jgi:hypothetical protein
LFGVFFSFHTDKSSVKGFSVRSCIFFHAYERPRLCKVLPFPSLTLVFAMPGKHFIYVSGLTLSLDEGTKRPCQLAEATGLVTVPEAVVPEFSKP